jgi:hypothetical protein
VTRAPDFFAARITSTVSFALTWAMWTCPPVHFASIASRAAMADSATAGHPRRPSSVATGPSFIAAPFVRWASSQWLTTGLRNIAAYSRARRITSEFMTGRPSSENPAAPAFAMRPISASSSPFSPLVTAPRGKMRASPASAARSRT